MGPPLLGARKIICAGFSFSGSSAVLDFLADHEGFAILPGGEMRLLRSRHTFFRALNDIKRSGSVSNEALESIRNVLLKGLPGEDRAAMSIARSTVLLKRAFGPFYAEQVDAYVASVQRDPTSAVVALAAARTFISALCNEWARRQDCHSVLLNQAVRPGQLHKIKIFDEATLIICRRDLRDQVIERRRHSIEDDNFSANAVATLARMEKARVRRRPNARSLLSWFRRLLRPPALGDSFRLRLGPNYKTQLIWFEDFVLKRSTREAVLEIAGRPDALRCTDRFNPLASRRNLFLYEQRPDLCPVIDEAQHALLYRREESVEVTQTERLDQAEYAATVEGNRAGAMRSTKSLSAI